MTESDTDETQCLDTLRAADMDDDAKALARVRALLDEWEGLARLDSVSGWFATVSKRLRAALDGEKRWVEGDQRASR